MPAACTRWLLAGVFIAALGGCSVFGGDATGDDPANGVGGAGGGTAGARGDAGGSDAAGGQGETGGVGGEGRAGDAGPAAGAPDVGVPADADRSRQDSPTNYTFTVEAPEALAEQIREQTFVGRWLRRADYDPLQFEGLVARLEEEVNAILQSNGYFSGRIDVDTVDRSEIRLRVRAGPRTTVNRVDLKMTRQGEPAPRLEEFARNAWPLPEGSFFDAAAWQRGKRRIIDALNQRGYLRARITDSSARIVRELTAASLSVDIESGPQIAFGPLKIEGLDRYDRRVVVDERPFAVGDPYDFDQMLKFQARLRLSGYFDEAVVLPDLEALAEDPQALQVPLRVQLVERKSKRFALGIGYSTDEGARGQIGLEHRDVLNRDWRLESAVVLSEVRARAFANVRTPYDADDRFVGFGGRVEREDVEGQLSTRSNSYIGLGWRGQASDSFLSMQYQTEEVKLEPTLEAPGLRDTRQALVFGFAHNVRRLDSATEPRDGYALTGQVSLAHEALATTRGFLRLYGKATRFMSVSRDSESFLRDGTLIVGTELGLVKASSRNDIPSENLFRTGGAQSIRGYRYLSLGVPERGAIVGGRYLALASVEYQHRMSDLYSLAVFLDVGNAGDDRGDFDPVTGAGFGVRLRTPVGPIHLDAAYGDEVNRWRLHFSVGYGL